MSENAALTRGAKSCQVLVSRLADLFHERIDAGDVNTFYGSVKSVEVGLEYPTAAGPCSTRACPPNVPSGTTRVRSSA